MEFEFDSRKIPCLILLFLTVSILLGSVEGENEIAHSTYYAIGYNISKGTYVSGSFPADIQKVDSDYLIIQSVASHTTASAYPSGYTLTGSTNWLSGEPSDLVSDDNVHMTFRSYHSRTNTANFAVNNTSNVDSSVDKGTHSSFSVQKTGPDSICDTLIEENNGDATNTTLIDAESFEGTWPPTSWTETSDWNRESDRTYDGTYSADYDGPVFGTSSGNLNTPYLDCSNASAIYMDFWYRDDDCDSDDFLLQYYNGSNWKLVSDLGSTTQEDEWLHYQEKITDSQYFVSAFAVQWRAEELSFGKNIWVDLVIVKKEAGSYNYELDLEVQWTDADYDETNEELAIYVDKGNNTRSLDAKGGYMIIGDGRPHWGSTTGTISFWTKWDILGNRAWGQHDDMETRFSGSNLVLDWGASSSTTSSTVFTVGKWYFIAIVWNENTEDLYLYVGDQDNPPMLDTLNTAWTSAVSTVAVTENNFMASKNGVDPTDGHGEDLRYWDADRTLAEIQGDYNTELTGSETNLRSYFKLNNNFDDIGHDNNDGSGSGSYSFSSQVPFGAAPTENIRVDAWNGTSWQNLLTDLTNGWNNISVSSYLVSSTFTIRFQGSMETGDTNRDSWHIDVTLLHVCSDDYAIEVELTGSSKMENWSRLSWTVNSAWTISSVDVTLQLHNYASGVYPTSGNGYMAYTSDDTPNTDENRNQTINVNPTDFRNTTGHWKIKIKGMRKTDTQFDFEVDWIEFKPYFIEHTVSTEFLFSGTTTNTATHLNLSVVSQCSRPNVNVTIQIWNYSSAAYALNGEAHLEYTSSGTNETKTLSITTNPQFYVSNTSAKIRITSVSATTQYQQKVNQIKLLYNYAAQSFDWVTPFMYALPIAFALLFLLVVILKHKKKTRPSTEEKINPFSKSFGMTHQHMTGKKMLLEIDPTTDYQNALFDFVSEAKNNGEKLFIFTGANSSLHSKFSGSQNTKFFLLTSKASSPQQINQKETLLPASDLSLLLNTFVRIQKATTKKPLNILFDNLSDTILLCEFEKTYKFIRWLIEAISSPKATTLFVFNPMAHDPRTSSSIRGLFQIRFAYAKSGPKVGTL